MRSSKRFGAVAFVFATASLLASACDSSLTMNPLPEGKNLDAWTVEFWRWFYGAPGATHPVLDATGANCAVGQTDPSRPVFFLAGTNTGAVDRTCKLPSGKPVFFGVQFGNIDNACGGMIPDLKAESQRYFDSIEPDSLAVTVDGVQLDDADLLVQKPFEFSYDIPANSNLYVVTNNCEKSGDHIDPSFSAGYWVMLAPLEPGTHEVQWRSDVPRDPYMFSNEVHYTLIVE